MVSNDGSKKVINECENCAHFQVCQFVSDHRDVIDKINKISELETCKIFDIQVKCCYYRACTTFSL